MEIGEDELAALHQGIFGLDGLLHLDDHLGHGIGLLDGGQNDSPHFRILLVGEATPLSCRMLHEYLMAVLDEFTHSRRGHAHAVLIVLDFFWNTNFHKL